MRVLLTRPLEDAQRTARALEDKGIGTLIAPIMTIRMLETGVISLNGVQAILLTSANGARALAESTAERALPVLAVGDATAREARSFGFERVHSAGGDVHDLARLVTRCLEPAGGPLFHVAGRDVAGDLQGLLEADGFTVRRQVLYSSEVAEDLPEQARRALLDAEIDAALFFSPRSAKAFAELVEHSPVAAECARVIAYCLSEAVAKAIGELTWRDVKVARDPTFDDLLQLVEEDAEASRRKP